MDFEGRGLKIGISFNNSSLIKEIYLENKFMQGRFGNNSSKKSINPPKILEIATKPKAQ